MPTLVTPHQHVSALSTDPTPAVRAFAAALGEGEHWYSALLGTVHLWSREEECYGGRYFRFLVAGEALDLLLVMERISWDFRHLLPQAERDALFFYARPPFTHSDREFAHLLGEEKYCSYLNYFYGVTLEEVLLHAVEDEILKATNYGVTRDLRDPESPLHALVRQEGARTPRGIQRGTGPSPQWGHDAYRVERVSLLVVQVPGCELLAGAPCERHPEGLGYTAHAARHVSGRSHFDTLRGYSE